MSIQSCIWSWWKFLSLECICNNLFWSDIFETESRLLFKTFEGLRWYFHSILMYGDSSTKKVKDKNGSEFRIPPGKLRDWNYFLKKTFFFLEINPIFNTQNDIDGSIETSQKEDTSVRVYSGNVSITLEATNKSRGLSYLLFDHEYFTFFLCRLKFLWPCFYPYMQESVRLNLYGYFLFLYFFFFFGKSKIASLSSPFAIA